MIKNRHELVGVIKEITPVETITSRAGKQYPKRSMILDLTPTDPNTNQRSRFDNVCELEFVGDFVCEKIDSLRIGAEVKVTFEITGFTYERDGAKRIFTKIKPFNVEAVTSQAAAAPAPAPAQPIPAPAPAPAQEDDTLPF